MGSRLQAAHPSAQGAALVLTSCEFLQAWILARCQPERGASLVEYALLVALIALVCVAAVTFLGQTVSSQYSSIGSGVAG
jgi:pilus assembly protein Flp/PilA